MTEPPATSVDLSTRLKRRNRVLLLLDAAERTAITPIFSRHLHAFAYLADVLSPVWNLPAFDGKILKVDGGPHYPDLQSELDRLVVLGLVEVTNLKYVGRGVSGARVEGDYALDFSSASLDSLLAALGANGVSKALDPADCETHRFLVELAGALATLDNDEIDIAATADVTYSTAGSIDNVVDFAAWADDAWAANPSWRTSERFKSFMPEGVNLTPGEKLYLYAEYLGRIAHG